MIKGTSEFLYAKANQKYKLNLKIYLDILEQILGDQRELRKSMTLLLRQRGSVGTKTYGKISLRSGHFDIWLLSN